MKTDKTNSPPSRTLARGLEVLELVLTSEQPMRLKDVAQALSLDTASAHRLLTTLEKTGYLSRLSVSKSYGPGRKIRTLSQSLPDTNKMMQRLRPLVTELTEATGQVAHIGIIQNNQVILTEVALSGAARVSVAQARGDVEEIYCSAIGKALVAFCPEEERRALLATQSFTAHTEFTITDPEVFERELQKVLETKIAFDDREGSLDVACIAAPIIDTTEFATASIGISTVAQHLRTDIRDEGELITAVCHFADLASASLLEVY